jgi:DNA-binding transcriptional ArsR family regulator
MSYENTCDVICVHEDKVNNALSFLEDDKSKKLLNILKKICDEKKLKIILSLIKEDELCVCDISLILKMSVASTSHHLRLLYKNEVLDFYKDGKMAYYFIKDDEIREFFSKNQGGVLKRVSSCLDTIKTKLYNIRRLIGSYLSSYIRR